MVSGLVFVSWIRAQGRFVVVLTSISRIPVVSWVARALTDEPCVTELVLGGSPTTLFRPGGGGPWTAIVFLNGATRRGRHHPDVQRLARGLARVGYLVLVPDLPGLAYGEISDRTLAGTTAAARAALRRPDARGGRVAFVGVSVGGTLALLAAAEPSLADRVSVIAGIAPYTDLVQAVRLATTRTYTQNGRLLRYDPKPFLTLVVARSLVAGLTPGPERELLLSRLLAVDDDAADPLAPLRRLPVARFSAETRALVRLLLNKDPGRFDELYGALPARMHQRMRRLSPIVEAERLRAPVELVSAPHDKYFPLSESRALVRRAPDARLTVTSTLAHAIPRISLTDVADLLRFDAFAVRVLQRLSS